MSKIEEKYFFVEMMECFGESDGGLCKRVLIEDLVNNRHTKKKLEVGPDPWTPPPPLVPPVTYRGIILYILF